MLYPINGLLLGSGKHTVSIQVFPRTGETEITKDAGVNIKVVHYKEKLVGTPETLVELDTPTDIGMKKIPLYTDSISFNATLPFNHKNTCRSNGFADNTQFGRKSSCPLQ